MSTVESKYAAMKSLSQGLTILRYLTTYGPLSSVSVSKGVGIHRTTVKRTLEALRIDGYVWYDSETRQYHATEHVLSFVNGSQSSNPVIRVFSELEHEITRGIPWPVDLTLFSEGSMIVRNSTHRLSPFSFHRRIIGRRLPCTSSAAGRAYLAFSDDNVRNDILSMISNMNDRERFYIQSRAFSETLMLTRQRGWAANNGEVQEETKFGAIAVPVMENNMPYGSLAVVFLKTAMTVDRAADVYLEKLRQFSHDISAYCRGNAQAI